MNHSSQAREAKSVEYEEEVGDTLYLHVATTPLLPSTPIPSRPVLHDRRTKQPLTLHEVAASPPHMSLPLLSSPLICGSPL